MKARSSSPGVLAALCAVAIVFLSPNVVLLSHAEADANSCVSVTRKMQNSDTTCLMCDPTYEFCGGKCQQLIDNVYTGCDGVCLPDGFYYDEARTLSGCWDKKLKAELKIQVGRCGCSAAGHKSSKMSVAATVGAVAVISALLLAL